METFNFPYFVENTTYEDVDRSVALGGGHDYQVEPAIPDPRLFVLSFKAFVWYMKNGFLDLVTDPDINAGRLDAFYNRHRLHKPFLFEHPKYGTVKVRFNKPLGLGEPSENSGGVVTNTKLEFKELI